MTFLLLRNWYTNTAPRPIPTTLCHGSIRYNHSHWIWFDGFVFFIYWNNKKEERGTQRSILLQVFFVFGFNNLVMTDECLSSWIAGSSSPSWTRQSSPVTLLPHCTPPWATIKVVSSLSPSISTFLGLSHSISPSLISDMSQFVVEILF